LPANNEFFLPRGIGLMPRSTVLLSISIRPSAMKRVVVKLEDGSRVATVVHAKDDADGMRWGFALDVVEQGIDADGDPITTLIAREMSEAPERAEKAPKPNASEQVALDILDCAMKEGDGTSASVGPNHEDRPVIAEHVWRQRFYAEARQGDLSKALEDEESRRLNAICLSITAVLSRLDSSSLSARAQFHCVMLIIMASPDSTSNLPVCP
jgi:hypothetical protein